jgi:hypothetical protein
MAQSARDGEPPATPLTRVLSLLLHQGISDLESPHGGLAQALPRPMSLRFDYDEAAGVIRPHNHGTGGGAAGARSDRIS